MRIAIVEDIATERKQLKDRLNGQLARLALEAEISAFDSGTAFLLAARKERFGLVFLDIYLEQENGVDTAKELRLFDPDCIILGGGLLQMPGFPRAALEEAVHRYARKPYPERTLDLRYSRPNQANGSVGAAIYAEKRLADPNYL